MSAVLQVRKARREDIAVILGMIVDDKLGATREDADNPALYEAAFDRIAAADSVTLYLAEVNGEPVGTFLFIVIPGLALKGMVRVEIEQVRIASGHRGKGLGRQMIGWAIGEAGRIGAGMVQLTMNRSRASTRHFYERMGFTASHDGFKLYL